MRGQERVTRHAHQLARQRDTQQCGGAQGTYNVLLRVFAILWGLLGWFGQVFILLIRPSFARELLGTTYSSSVAIG